MTRSISFANKDRERQEGKEVYSRSLEERVTESLIGLRLQFFLVSARPCQAAAVSQIMTRSQFWMLEPDRWSRR